MYRYFAQRCSYKFDWVIIFSDLLKLLYILRSKIFFEAAIIFAFFVYDSAYSTRHDICFRSMERQIKSLSVHLQIKIENLYIVYGNVC